MAIDPERQFWIEVIAALKLVISVIERYKLGKGKPTDENIQSGEWFIIQSVSAGMERKK